MKSKAVKSSTKRRTKKVTPADIPRVGPGTPAGEWFRKYWLVVGTAQDLHDIPQAVKVLGEELVLFRDEFGRLGLLGLHCPHRGTSLEYGDIEDGGIRCPYHGWLFNVGGQCLEMPAEKIRWRQTCYAEYYCQLSRRSTKSFVLMNQ